MASGNPVANFYASTPLEAAALDPYRGIWHGPDQPGQKVLADLGLMTPTAGLVGQYMLLDYLLYYPFIDGDDADVQVMDNTLALSRYADGEGVMVMAVVVAPTAGSGVFTFDYVNQDGIARTSPTQACNTTAANIATIGTSQQAVTNAPAGPFLKLAAEDTGVRSITSIQFSVPNGGLFSLVLVKPLTDSVIREINTMKEVDSLRERFTLPVIEDGAYLNLIVNCAATVAAGSLVGYANFAWTED